MRIRGGKQEGKYIESRKQENEKNRGRKKKLQSSVNVKRE